MSDAIEYRKNIILPVAIYPELNDANFVDIEYEYFCQHEDFSNITYDWSPLCQAQAIQDSRFGAENNTSSLLSLDQINEIATKLIKSNPLIFTRAS